MVYDNQHLGSHMGVVVHFTNEATEYSAGGVRIFVPHCILHFSLPNSMRHDTAC